MALHRLKFLVCLITATLALGTLLGACGQKGDLYQPVKPTPQQSTR